MKNDELFAQDEYYDNEFSKLTALDAVVENVVFEDCDFVDCDLSGVKFKHCKFTQCRFIRCNMSLVKLTNSRLFHLDFIESKLVGVDFTQADWPSFHVDFELSFKRSILNDISMFGLTLNELEMDECKIHDADFREGNFRGSQMKYCDFSNSLFMHTNLEAVDFSDSYNFEIDVLENQINKAIFSRFEALNLLKSLGIVLVD